MTTLKNENKKNQKSKTFVLKEKIRQTNDVLTLKFSPLKGSVFSFRPGQFVLMRFLNNRLNRQVRAYSISSCPQDKFLALTVKKIGSFSSALHNLKIGGKVKISPPQGSFYPQKSMKNLVFLAAGVGIAPFYSLIKSFYLQGASEKITLFYSNRTKKEIIFFKELNEIAQDWPSFKIIYLLTREKIKDEKFKECCRLNTKILKKYLKNLKGKHYFICGPIEFVNDLCKELKRAGVKENFIKTEAFY